MYKKEKIIEHRVNFEKGIFEILRYPYKRPINNYIYKKKEITEK